MAIGRRIKIIREQKGLTREELASMLGVTPSAISNYENNISHPKEPILYKLMEVLAVDANSLFRDNMQEIDIIKTPAIDSRLTNDGRQIGLAYEKAPPKTQQDVKYILREHLEETAREFYAEDNVISLFVDVTHMDDEASAGTGWLVNDDCAEMIKIRLSSLPSDFERWPERYFTVTVSGDSMEPKIYDGDIALIARDPVNVGEIGLFVMDGEGYIKEHRQGVLHSLNHRKYDDIPLVEGVHCCGRFVKVIRAEDIEE